MSETVTAVAVWSDPLRPTITDEVSVETWAPIKQADANRDEYLRVAMSGRVPGALVDVVVPMQVAVISAGSAGHDYQDAVHATPSTPFGHTIGYADSVDGYIRFLGRPPHGGYLKSARVWLFGAATDPGSGNRPRIKVAQGGFTAGSSSLEGATNSDWVTNDVADWGEVYSISVTLATPYPSSYQRIVEVEVGSGQATSVVVLGAEMVIASSDGT